MQQVTHSSAVLNVSQVRDEIVMMAGTGSREVADIGAILEKLEHGRLEPAAAISEAAKIKARFGEAN